MESPSVRHLSPGRKALMLSRLILSLPVVLLAVEWWTFQSRSGLNGALHSSGEDRRFLIHVPDSYEPGRPTPLVFSLHGGGGWPAQQRELSGWNEVADEHGFIVVYPAGVEALGFTRAWRTRAGEGLNRDVQFFADLIDDLAGSYSIDQDRIYVNGLSNGGGMTFALSCTLGERIAAVGLVGAAQTLDDSWCPQRQPMPAMVFHGLEDTAVPFAGGTSWVAPQPFPSVLEWVGDWALRNGCDLQDARLEREREFRRTTFVCPAGAPVILFEIDRAGHTWPGGEPLPEWFVGKTTTAVSATEEMWTFFSKHSRRDPRALDR